MNVCRRCSGSGRISVNRSVYIDHRTCPACGGHGQEQAMILATDIVYIAGPMTGLPDVNRPAFHAAAAELVARFGCTVLNPAEHPDGLSYCEYMELAMEKLKRANAVLLLPDFWLSKGASFEFEAAGRDGKTFYVISKDMRIWPFHICKEIGR